MVRFWSQFCTISYWFFHVFEVITYSVSTDVGLFCGERLTIQLSGSGLSWDPKGYSFAKLRASWRIQLHGVSGGSQPPHPAAGGALPLRDPRQGRPRPRPKVGRDRVGSARVSSRLGRSPPKGRRTFPTSSLPPFVGDLIITPSDK